MSDVNDLGPMWVNGFRSAIEKKRNTTASMSARCKPDGDYRKQIEMVLAELDVMLAAREMLALLIESQTSIGGDWRERRDAIVAKATGEPS